MQKKKEGYDGIELFARAVDFMLQRGIRYEEPSIAAAEARKIYFQGCSGNVAIGAETNSRK